MSKNLSYNYHEACGIERERAIRLHHQRYQEVGFFRKDEKDPYEPNSNYFVAESMMDNTIVGVTRLIFEKLEELPTMKYFSLYDLEKAKLMQLDRNQYAEISAFTKLPQHDVGIGLIRTVLQYSRHTGISHWICCIDERVYNYMHRMFKFPFKVVGAPKLYLGSTSIPCVLNLTECLNTLEVYRPILYNYLSENSYKTNEVVQ
jgi:N-acyl-L-homoserine lactone synthetase